MTNQTISDLIALINQSGGIPLQVTTVNQVSWAQYIPSLVIGLASSAFVLWWIYSMLATAIGSGFSIGASLKKWKKLTGRNVVVIKHTQSEMFSASMINQKTTQAILKAMMRFKGKDFDLILHTPGGEIFSSLYISRLLRNYPGKIRVYVPVHSMSGGTLLALSGSELYMTNSACLGPIDPQLGNLFKYGSAKSWNHIVKMKGKKAEDSTISFSLMGNQYTKTISERVNEIVTGKVNPTMQRKFVDFLTSGDVEHGYHLTAKDLIKYGLEIKEMNQSQLELLLKMLVKNKVDGEFYR